MRTTTVRLHILCTFRMSRHLEPSMDPKYNFELALHIAHTYSMYTAQGGCMRVYSSRVSLCY